jgi:hypothetical protein
MRRPNPIYRGALIITVAFTLYTCGGGGGGSGPVDSPLPPPPPPPQGIFLTWEPPTQYVSGDNVMNPLAELGAYRIYARTDNNFNVTDNYVELAAVANNQLVATVDLRSFVSSFGLQKGVPHYFAIRVVSAVDNVISDFSEPSQPYIFD